MPAILYSEWKIVKKHNTITNSVGTDAGGRATHGAVAESSYLALEPDDDDDGTAAGALT